MKHVNKLFKLFVLSALLFVSCQKNNIPDLENSILFSVDLDNNKFKIDNFVAYIAAYTPEGDLLNYANLSDSSIWNLMAKYNGDKIDILYIEIWHESLVKIKHIRDVAVGQIFNDQNPLKADYSSSEYVNVTLKVEDFGNRVGNETSTNFYEEWPHKHIRGFAYPYGEMTWDTVEDGYTYKSTYYPSDPNLQGIELILFERGTNLPYVSYIDIPAAGINPDDTITLDKNNFILGDLKTIQVNSSSDFLNIFLYTYNSEDGRKDLITSFEDVPSDGVKSIRYVSSDVLPISYWDFRYFTNSATSYTICSNKVMPSVIDIIELTGVEISKSENQFVLTHANIIPNKNLARSSVIFSKSNNEAQFDYSLYFEGSECNGSTTISLFEIPEEILNKYNGFKELNGLEWKENQYEQIYTNISKNSPLDFLKNSLNWKDNNSSNEEYYYETFYVKL